MKPLKLSIRRIGLTALLVLFAFSSTGCQLSLIKLPSWLAGTGSTATPDIPSGPTATPMLGVTPLQSAVAGGHLEITRLLLEAGASPNVRERSGDTPLHAAAQNGDVEIVRSLIFGGANVETINEKNEKPLDIALKSGHHEVVNLLKAGITRRFRGSRLRK